jgi:hypothetical protein
VTQVGAKLRSHHACRLKLTLVGFYQPMGVYQPLKLLNPLHQLRRQLFYNQLTLLSDRMPLVFARKRRLKLSDYPPVLNYQMHLLFLIIMT